MDGKLTPVGTGNLSGARLPVGRKAGFSAPAPSRGREKPYGTTFSLCLVAAPPVAAVAGAEVPRSERKGGGVGAWAQRLRIQLIKLSAKFTRATHRNKLQRIHSCRASSCARCMHAHKIRGCVVDKTGHSHGT
eukprot:scaffold64801_cov30-Tisochrysis_lutea.AAC.2